MDELTRERYPFDLAQVEREKWARPTRLDPAAAKAQRKLVDQVVEALYRAVLHAK